MTSSLVISGVPWLDEQGRTVNAHGICVVRENGRYYLFGEYKTDDKNMFVGFSCYESDDLVHWRFVRMALPQQPDGPLGPERVGERVKVMKCPKTGKFIMLAHSDDLKYCDPKTLLAVSDTIDGEYRVVGPLLYHGEPIRMWDLGTFQDTDGTGYLLLHEGDIYRLSDDYMTAEEKVAEGIGHHGESPAMAHVGDTYYLMLSNKTSWDRNDNFYLTAPSPAGPWTYRGPFAPEGTCTWNSQCSFIFPLPTEHGIRQIYMGDRWAYPHQASSATHVWLPLQFDEDTRTMSLPEYVQAWDPATGEPVALGGMAVEGLSGRSDRQDDRFSADFDVVRDGQRLAITAHAAKENGFGVVEITDDHGEAEHRLLVDFYGPAPADGIVYVSPELKAGRHTVTVTVNGDNSECVTKSGKHFGSTGSFVNVIGAMILG